MFSAIVEFEPKDRRQQTEQRQTELSPVENTDSPTRS